MIRLDDARFLTEFAERLPSPEQVHIEKMQKCIRQLEIFSYNNRAVMRDLHQYRITEKGDKFLQKCAADICKISKAFGIWLSVSPGPESLLLHRARCLETLSRAAFDGLKSDYPYVRQMSLKLLGDLVKREFQVSQARDAMVQYISDPDVNVRLTALYLGKILVEQGDVDFTLFIPVIQTGLRDPLAVVRQDAFWLWRVLIDKGQELHTSEKRIIRQGLRDTDPAIRHEVFELIQAVTKKGRHLDLAIELFHLERCRPRFSSKVAKLWIALMCNKQIFEWLYAHLHADLRCLFPSLLQVKPNKNQSCEIGILLHYLENKNTDVHKAAENVLIKFIQNKCGVEQTFETAQKWIHSEKNDLYYQGWKLLSLLFGLRLDLLEGLNDPHLEVRALALIQFIKMGTQPDNHAEILTLIDSNLQSQNGLIRQDALELLKQLVKKHLCIDEALAISQRYINDLEPEVRRAALETFTLTLKNSEDPIEEVLVTRIVTSALQDSDPRIRAHAIGLLKELVTTFVCFETASQALSDMVGSILDLPYPEQIQILDLGRELVVRDECIDLVLQLLQLAIDSPAQAVRYRAQPLAFDMIVNDHKITEGTEALKKGMLDENDSVRTLAKNCSLQLMDFNKSTVTLQLAIDSTNPAIAIELFTALLEDDEECALPAAKLAYQAALENPTLDKELVKRFECALCSF